jgi:hypothetical protein
VVKHENFSATKLHDEKALSTRRRLATERHDDKRGTESYSYVAMHSLIW